MSQNRKWALGILTVALVFFAGYKYATTGDTMRTPQVAANQVAPALGWKIVQIATTSSSSDTVDFGQIVNLFTGFTTTAACSVSFGVDPALVTLGWEKAAAADTFLAGHPRAGEVVREATFQYVPAGGSLDIPARFSRLIVKGGGNGHFDGTGWFNY
jgi:NADH:ubiquinone oxidoreductase subunit 2 (subunit N)